MTCPKQHIEIFNNLSVPYDVFIMPAPFAEQSRMSSILIWLTKAINFYYSLLKLDFFTIYCAFTEMNEVTSFEPPFG